MYSAYPPLFVESVKAGFPSPAADYAEQGLDLNQFLITHPSATFFLRVTGDSMENAGIFPGDYVVVDRSLCPVHRDIIVAAVNGDFTLKRYIKGALGPVLHPENPNYPDIQIGPNDELDLYGVVTSVIRRLKNDRPG